MPCQPLRRAAQNSYSRLRPATPAHIVKGSITAIDVDYASGIGRLMVGRPLRIRHRARSTPSVVTALAADRLDDMQVRRAGDGDAASSPFTTPSPAKLSGCRAAAASSDFHYDVGSRASLKQPPACKILPSVNMSTPYQGEPPKASDVAM